MTRHQTTQTAPAALTPRQIELVRESFAAVIPIRQTAATLFYARLFELAPEVRPLFPRDLDAQGAKLMAVLAAVVRDLDRPEAMRPDIEGLALRHVGYGATAAHYPAVGAALIWTMEQGLGARFTDEVRAAWTAAYGLLSGIMLASVRGIDPAV
jgi:nitric oxide dioxygenase